MRTCGIYAIIDIHGERYVGSSIKIEERLKGHFKGLETKTHQNRMLQRAYNKYGKDYFRTEILEICSQEIRFEREQHYMDISGKYNLAKIAEGGGIKKTKAQKKAIGERMKGNKHLLGHKHSEETKKKISEKSKGRKPSLKTREKASERMKRINVENPQMKGRNFSEHHRKAISEAMKGRKLSEERKLKISEQLRLRWKDPTYREKAIDELRNRKNKRGKNAID